MTTVPQDQPKSAKTMQKLYKKYYIVDGRNPAPDGRWFIYSDHLQCFIVTNTHRLTLDKKNTSFRRDSLNFYSITWYPKKNHLGMVHTSHLWWFWGWFIFSFNHTIYHYNFISVFVKPKGYVGKSCEAYEFPVSNAKCSPNSFVELHVTS